MFVCKLLAMRQACHLGQGRVRRQSLLFPDTCPAVLSVYLL